MFNILTIDFEEWYDAEYVKEKARETRKSQATKDAYKTLHLLDEHDIVATFFVVGELAEKHPDLLDEIRANGHEIAFHAYHHEPLWKKTPERLESEVIKFKRVTRERCIGFRAPSFSLSNKTSWALDVLERNGYKYDSSIFPTKTPLYGVWDAPTKPYKPCRGDVASEDPSGGVWEFPLLVYTSTVFRIPMAGGFYLRFFPVKLILRALKNANSNEYPAVLYLHTWELNPETPRLRLGLYKSFITYHNLGETNTRLKRILSSAHFTSIRDYMERSGLN